MSSLEPKRLCSTSSLVIEADGASTVLGVASVWKGKECGELLLKTSFFLAKALHGHAYLYENCSPTMRYEGNQNLICMEGKG